jgi:hypothetical protein
MNPRMQYLVEMIVTVYLAVSLLPDAVGQLLSSNVTGWAPGLVTLFKTFVPTIVIISVALLLMPPEIKAKIGL